MKTNNNFPYHVFLVGLFPLLSLYSQNTGYIGVSQFFRPAFVLGLVGLLVWGVLGGIYRDRYRGALMASVVLALTLSFKMRGLLLHDVGFPGFGEYYYKKLFAVDLLLMLGVFVGIWRLGAKRQGVTRVLNHTLLMLNAVALVFAVVGLVSSSPRVGSVVEHSGGVDAGVDVGVGESVDESVATVLVKPQTPPDIYYFILDGYGRSDVLKELYGYDNSAFTDRLQKLGFLVGARSLANYPHTIQSLSSSLNMDYMDGLVDAQEAAKRQYNYVYYELINQSRSHRLLKGAGYQTVRNETGWHYTTSIYADHNLVRIWGFTELESTLWAMTSGSLIVRYYSDTFLAFDAHRERILRAFEEVREMPKVKTPTFSFIHILSPHPPFVFGRDGEPVDLWNPKQDNFLMDSPLAHGVVGASAEARTLDYQKKYGDQAAFISDRVADTVEAILEQSETPPIIVIQGDHGPHSLGSILHHNDEHTRERFPILNAYYLPAVVGAGEEGTGVEATGVEGVVTQAEIDDLSPVNSFRFIFNRYFGTDFKLLPNRSYWVTPENMFEYVKVPDSMREVIQAPLKAAAAGAGE